MALFTPRAFVEAFSKESPLGIHIQTAQVAETLKQKGYTGQVGICRNPAAAPHYRIIVKWKYTPRSKMDASRREIVRAVAHAVRDAVTSEVYITRDFALQNWTLCDGRRLTDALCIEFLPTSMGGRLPRPFKPISRVF